jgi:spore coat polysaccharide biosynthesis protein SpsF (cytidylyltransferase family)
MTLDYREDYIFFKSVLNGLKADRNIIPLKKIIKFIKRNPEIAKLNWFRQKHYYDNQKQKTFLKIKKPV